jgi:BRCT domain type II-containing protein
VITVRHTEEEIQAAAERFDKWADELDPATVEVTDVSDLREVAEAAEAVRADEARLTEAVTKARAHGRSWTRIADSMGVSRQAARQRFADKIDA